jgi:hypothetical protein
MAPTAKTKALKRKKVDSKSEDHGGDDGDAFESPVSDQDSDEVKALNSDNLDDDEDDSPQKPKQSKRSSTKKKRKVPPKKRQRKNDSDDELEDGQEVVGAIVTAPTTGRGTVAQILLPNTSLNNCSASRANIPKYS